MGLSTFKRTNYSGWLVRNRAELLAKLAADRIVPRFERVVCEHVTYRYPDPHPAPPVGAGLVWGYVAGDGVDALAVTVDGSSVRPDGKSFHVTLSLAPGRKPAEANAALASGLIVPVGPYGLELAAF